MKTRIHYTIGALLALTSAACAPGSDGSIGQTTDSARGNALKGAVNVAGAGLLFSAPPEGGAVKNYDTRNIAVLANVFSDGSATGGIQFNWDGAFPADWGSSPPNTNIFLGGTIDHGSVDSNGTIRASGILNEIDTTNGQGVVLSINDAFTVTFGGPDLGRNEFILQWCQLPAFPMELTQGDFSVVRP